MAVNTMHTHTTRRQALLWLASSAPLLSAGPAVWAASATAPATPDPRLVVVMLRGALDGLAAVPATGDPAWPTLGRADGDGVVLPLDGFFGLHPSLAGLHRWYQAGQLLVVHAVASPYRDRSHFDAQQVLESGGARPFVHSDGWLGRALQMGGGTAMALSPAMPLALQGAEQARTWTPARRQGPDTPFMDRVTDMYRADPLLARAWAAAMAQEGMARGMQASNPAMGNTPGGDAGWVATAQQAGAFLSAPAGPRVAWLDVDGWDTHAQQAGRLQRLLAALDQGLLALRAALEPFWDQTTVVVVTEFGRTAALNGTGGTDHGTGGVALVAGGAVAGGRVWADWPGLAQPQLLDGRDLRPTTDLRALWSAVVQRQWGLDPAQVAGRVLPGYTGAGLGLWHV